MTAVEKWGLGPDDLRRLKPDLIFTRVSGYGQTGPWSSRPGYASVCEAESGFRYINGQPDPETGALSGPPVRPNISLGDTVAGLHAAFGTVGLLQTCHLIDSIEDEQVLALVSRLRGNAKERTGKTVDVSIFERLTGFLPLTCITLTFR